MRIQLLMTGNELMSGDTIDSNSAAIAQRLSRHGLSVYRKIVVGDDPDLLLAQMTALCADGDLLIVNGGLGPTVDDLTAQVLARLLQQPLVEHADALDHLRQWCAKRNYSLDGANRKQALLPEGVTIVANKSGSAVGFSARHRNCLIYCTPGVPSELFTMLDDEIIPALLAHFTHIEPVTITRLRLFGIGESRLQQSINDHFPDWPGQLELGFRAGLPVLEVKLTTRNHHDEHLHALWRARLEQLCGDYIIGTNDLTLPQCVVQNLLEQDKKLCTAESCTGGLIASQIVSIAGASQVFEAGYICYANHIKQSTLGVSSTTLQQHGAVSEAVVREMAEGALRNSCADLVIAVSGIAGPQGGTAERPAGTVWIAWGERNAVQARLFFIPGNREFVQNIAAAIALDLTRRHLLGLTGEPQYFKDKAPRTQ
jgi:nicotinamide-nucleotide amidase